METKLQKVAEKMVSELENFSKDMNSMDSYSIEKGANKIFREFENHLFQAMVGEIPKSVNSKVSIKTTLGSITVSKSHPMSIRPMGFHISPLLQEHMCRIGSKMVFSEASEEFWQFIEQDISDKQIERVCHCYGEKLEELDWNNAYSDAIQLKTNYPKEDTVYAMVDGSMLFTREEGWKEIKVGRVFGSSSMINISKNRTLLSDSVYTAHLGNASDFWERFSTEIPQSNQLVFINDGAKWIWKHIEECYPNSVQILDFFHCKEHIYQFTKDFFSNKDKQIKFAEQICDMLLDQQVSAALEKIRQLEPKSTKRKSVKEKLLKYLENNKKRINYGKYKKMGLLIGSGAIESAQRDVIQKRMKLSGQRWTKSGAQQIVNLRVHKKSNRWERVVDCINKNIVAKNVA